MGLIMPQNLHVLCRRQHVFAIAAEHEEQAIQVINLRIVRLGKPLAPSIKKHRVPCLTN